MQRPIYHFFQKQTIYWKKLWPAWPDRNSKSGEGKHIIHSEISLGKFELPYKAFRLLQISLSVEPKPKLSNYILTEISGI